MSLEGLLSHPRYCSYHVPDFTAWAWGLQKTNLVKDYAVKTNTCKQRAQCRLGAIPWDLRPNFAASHIEIIGHLNGLPISCYMDLVISFVHILRSTRCQLILFSKEPCSGVSFLSSNNPVSIWYQQPLPHSFSIHFKDPWRSQKAASFQQRWTRLSCVSLSRPSLLKPRRKPRC